MHNTLCILWPMPEGLSGIQPLQSLELRDFPDQLASAGVRLSLDLPKNLCPQQELTLSFDHIRDFRPRHLVSRTPFVHDLVQAMDLVSQAETENRSAEWITEKLGQWPDLPLDLSSFDLHPSPKKTAKGAGSVDRILDMVSMPDSSPPHGLADVKNALHRQVQAVLNHIYSQSSFRQLEILWRSLQLLFRQCGSNQRITCRILPYAPGELETALQRVFPDLVHHPLSLILIDEPINSSALKVRIMKQLAGIAEILLVPVLGWLEPDFFHGASWTECDHLPYLPHHLQRPEYAKWRAAMQQPAANWVVLTCNRFLLRPAYTRDAGGEDGALGFEEGERLWGSPVFALAALMLSSSAAYGWPTHISQWKQIHLQGMPVMDAGRHQMPTETIFSDERLEQMSRIGVCPLMGQLDRDILFSPVDSTWGGEPLSRQLFLAAISQELIQCKDDFGPDVPTQEVVRSHLRTCFDRVWSKRGGGQPKALHIEMQESKAGYQSRITLRPSKDMLPSAQEDVVLDMNW